jgi:hypothetical protein
MHKARQHPKRENLFVGYSNYLFPKERFTLLTPEENLTSYQFGSKSAVHPFCSHCGVASFYFPCNLPHLAGVPSYLNLSNLGELKLCRQKYFHEHGKAMDVAGWKRAPDLYGVSRFHLKAAVGDDAIWESQIGTTDSTALLDRYRTLIGDAGQVNGNLLSFV